MHNRSHWSKSSCRLDWWQPTKEWTSSLIATYYELKAFFLIVSNLAACFFLKNGPIPASFRLLSFFSRYNFNGSLLFHLYFSLIQCDQIWGNSATLAKFCKSLAYFGRFISYLVKCWAFFGKFVTLLVTLLSFLSLCFIYANSGPLSYKLLFNIFS